MKISRNGSDIGFFFFDIAKSGIDNNELIELVHENCFFFQAKIIIEGQLLLVYSEPSLLTHGRS